MAASLSPPRLLPSGDGAITVVEMLEQVIEKVERDAVALGCLKEVQHCRTIVGNGTSADTQLAVFEQAQASSEGKDGALRAVTDWIAEATLQ